MKQQELDAVVAALDDALLTMSRPTVAALRLRLGWSRQKTYEAIREAVRLGMIERVGVTKWTWFRMPFRREDEFRDRLHAAIDRTKKRSIREQADHAQAVKDAFRRGAEAMRKRCAMWIKHNSHEDGLGMGSQRIESALAALPIPEEP